MLLHTLYQQNKEQLQYTRVKIQDIPTEELLNKVFERFYTELRKSSSNVKDYEPTCLRVKVSVFDRFRVKFH